MFTCLPALFYAMTGGGGPGAFQRFEGFGLQYIYNGLDEMLDTTGQTVSPVRADKSTSSTLVHMATPIITVSGSSNYAKPIAKILADGTLAWSTSISVSANLALSPTHYMLSLNNGNYVSFNGRSTNNTYAILIDGATGALSTQVRFQGESGRLPHGIVEVSSGNILFMGIVSSYSYGSANRSVALATVTSAALGYSSAKAFIGSSAAAIDFYCGTAIPPVTGQVWNTPGAWLIFASAPTTISLERGIHAVLVDNAANIIRQATYAPDTGRADAAIYSLAREYLETIATPSGDVLVPFQHAYTKTFPEGDTYPYEVVVGYLNFDGTKKWTTAIDPLSTYDLRSDQPEDPKFAFDASGDVYVSLNTYVVNRDGSSPQEEVNYAVDLLKLSGTDGSLIWKKRIVSRVNGAHNNEFYRNSLFSSGIKVITVGAEERLQMVLAGGGTGNSLATIFVATLDTNGTALEDNPNELLEVPCTLTTRAFPDITATQVSILTVDRTANSSIISAAGTFVDAELGAIPNLTGIVKTPAFTYA